jgi:SAM-dependent methyltransferase
MTADRWAGGDDYEGFVGRWSRHVAPVFVDWLDVAAGGSWVDVGCGTGALTVTILDRAAPASVVAIDPSTDFIAHARGVVRDPRARFAVASADAVPVGDGSADAVVAALVLNFVPDLAAALAEMRRVARPGGRIAGYVWDYAGRMDLLRAFWDAAIAEDPAAIEADEGQRFPICRPEALTAAFGDAGLAHVEVRIIDIPTVFADFDDYWTPFLQGQGPAGAYVAGLSDADRAALRAEVAATVGDGPFDLSATAWWVRGTVPA